MKNRFRIILLAFAITLLFGCNDDDEVVLPNSFLSELRPTYFDQLDFNTRSQVLQLPDYLEKFTETFSYLENEYEAGEFTSKVDIENMKLVSMYYSFLLTTVTRAYLDDLIEFEDIIGTRDTSFFSGLNIGDSNFEKQEMKAMMTRSKEVAQFGVNLESDGDDRLYGCYVAAKQISERLDNADRKNDPAVQMEMIGYVDSTLNDYFIFPLWNVVMSQVYFDNYDDALNTFDNPAMNIVFNNIVNRLNPNFLPVNTESFNSILAPMYQFDILLKKTDWAIQNLNPPNPQDIQAIGEYIQRMDMVSSNIQNERGEILNNWDFKNTFDERLNKLEGIKIYINQISNGNSFPKPQIAPFINSKEFKQAYQCYSCHKPTNL